MINPAADTAMYLADWGVPLILSWRSTRQGGIGVPDYKIDPIRFLEQGRAIPSCVVTVDRATAAILNTEWTVTIDGEVRPVIEIPPIKGELIDVYLGDPKTC
ncbi:MAG TPA: hypothetical protein DCZ63_14805 [Geobacter sp.]|nr:hypothetical protein [Geobacter sp.]